MTKKEKEILLSIYENMNETGKEKIIRYAQDLSEISKYKSKRVLSLAEYLPGNSRRAAHRTAAAATDQE